MSKVLLGNASLDENGNISGGAAGDQTGKEVCTRDWYLHTKGWVVYRPNDSAVAEKIAKDMEYACANNKIGYDQSGRNTLYTQASKYGFDCSKVTTACECDCSSLVRVCCCYAGIMVGNFNTSTEHSVLMATGKFTKLTDAKYTESSDYLKRGDILVTKTKGHTVVVLSNGAKVVSQTPTTPSTSSDFKVGDKVIVNGAIYSNGKGTGNSVVKNNATMYIVGYAGASYPYCWGVATLANGTRQGWASPSVLQHADNNTATSTVEYFPKTTYTGTSIVSGLKAIGVDSSYAYRKQIAAANGITGYTGTAAQNSSMLKLLKEGKLIKP